MGLTKSAKPSPKVFRRPCDVAQLILDLPSDASSVELGQALRHEVSLAPKIWTAVLGILSRCRRWELAVALVQWLRSERVDVNEFHYSAVITACDKAGQWRAALDTLDSMWAVDAVAKPNTFCYSAAISACERGGEWQLALGVFDDMASRGVSPNHFCYSGAIRACARAGRWQQALGFLETMRSDGATPNVHSYTAAISACGRGRQWQRAVGLYNEVRNVGLDLDVVLCGCSSRLWSCRELAVCVEHFGWYGDRWCAAQHNRL